MNKYKIYDWEFDSVAWANAIANARRHFSDSDLAELLDMSEASIVNWGARRFHEAAPWPNMTNFIRICNALDLDPRSFFVLKEDK